MYTYRQIFKQAFKITWQYPSLWLFGLFVVLLGSTGELELILSSAGFGSEGVLFSFWQGLTQGGFFTAVGLKGLIQVIFFSPFYFFSIVLIFLIVLGLSILTVWLIIVSQSALIGKAISISKNQELSQEQSFKLGLMKFWPVLGLNVLARFIIWFLLVAVAFLSILEFKGSIVIFIIGFNIFLLLVLIISFMTKYAICGVVLKNWQFIQGLKSAWKIFINNWLLSLEVAIIFLFISLMVNFLLIFFFSQTLLFFASIYTGFLFALVLILLFFIVVFVAVQVLLTIFHWVIWAIIFEILTGKQTILASRLKSGFSKIFNKSR